MIELTSIFYYKYNKNYINIYFKLALTLGSPIL